MFSGNSSKHNFLIFLVVGLICYGYSNFVRYEQYRAWENNPAHYFVNGEPMMTTLDSYYWLRLAKEYSEGYDFGGGDLLRSYPDHGRQRPEFVPSISYLIAKTASIFNISHYKAGLILASALSGLFIFPLAIYFFMIGYPIAGLLGGMIGTVSLEYLIRTGIGRVDTDVLILFFPFLASAFILCAAKSYRLINLLTFSALAGGAVYLQILWAQVGTTFVIPFAAVLFLTLLARRPEQNATTQSSVPSTVTHFPLLRKIIVAVLSLVIYLTFSFGLDLSMMLTTLQQSPLARINYYLTAYVPSIDELKLPRFSNPQADSKHTPEITPDESNLTAIVFPNILQTVTEVKSAPIRRTLRLTLTSPLLSAIGLSGFLLFFLAHWRKLLPILPILFVGLLAFLGARRLALFLGPFVGIGYGYLVTLFLTLVYRYLPDISVKHLVFFRSSSNRATHWLPRVSQNLLKDISGYAIAAGVFLSLSSATAVGLVPKPSVPAPNFASFLDLKKNLPPKSSIYAWWDYGYALTEITKHRTFHDGGYQTSPKTTLIARSIVSESQKELYNTISYLTSGDVRGEFYVVGGNTSFDDILSNVYRRSVTQAHYFRITPPSLKQDNVFVVFTRDMIRKYRAINSIGKWEVTDKKLKPRQGYKILNCSRLHSYTLSCQNGAFDLKTGLTPKRARLKEAVLIDDGFVKRRTRYPHKNGLYLQVLISGSRLISVHMVGEEVSQSNFNQMFILGRYDKNLFDQYYSAFPWTRVFRVKSDTQRDIAVVSKSN